ncbi:hypothetical protein [Mesorhizobium carmichaelinearum]|uniref:hypothetical protein n=1 Tax=Mesorhizobium carmichaelinearum TaxID=1208188 RepID=UPI000BA4CE3C|nr:hypothetical protein [Mesorhizobium carmichaelinearum]
MWISITPDVPEEKRPRWGILAIFAATLFVMAVGWSIFELFFELPATQVERTAGESRNSAFNGVPDDQNPKPGKIPSAHRDAAEK